MPGLITHLLCAERSIALSGCESLRLIIKKNHEVFATGAQGPDPFMFYGVLPWKFRKNIKKVRDYSDMIHEYKTNAVFEGMLKEAKESNDDVKKAYVAGFLTHNVLDSIAHPYVYYMVASNKRNTLKEHQIFECQIDYGMLSEMKIDLKDYRFNQMVKTKQSDRVKMAEVLNAGLESGFSVNDTTEQLVQIFDDLKSCEDFLYDETGNKAKWIALLEKIFNKPGVGTNMMIPRAYDNHLDAMNYRQDEWCMPTDPNEVHNESVVQLFSAACLRATMLLENYEKYLDDEITLEQMLKLIDNRNYCTGRSDDMRMWYFKEDQQ